MMWVGLAIAGGRPTKEICNSSPSGIRMCGVS